MPQIDEQAEAVFEDYQNDFGHIFPALGNFISGGFSLGEATYSASYTITENITSQIVNCFLFGACDDFKTTPFREICTGFLYSDAWQQYLEYGEHSYGEEGTNLVNCLNNVRQMEEGWTVSPDNHLLWSRPYSRPEKLTVHAEEYRNSASEIPKIERDRDDLSLQACKVNSGQVCRCEYSQLASCPCSQVNPFVIVEQFVERKHKSRTATCGENEENEMTIGFHLDQELKILMRWRETGSDHWGHIKELTPAIQKGDQYKFRARCEQKSLGRDDDITFEIFRKTGSSFERVNEVKFSSNPIFNAKIDVYYWKKRSSGAL